MNEGTYQPQKGANTGTIALIIAGILLFVVCGMAYKDYLEAKMLKEWGYPQQGYPQNGQYHPGNPNQVPNNGQYQNPQYGQQPQTQQQQGGNYVPPQQQIVQTPVVQTQPPAPVTNTTPETFNVFDAAPPVTPAVDPELEKQRQELEKRKQERQLAEQKLQNLQNGEAAIVTPSLTPPQNLETAESVIIENSVAQMAGGNPGTIVPTGADGQGLAFGPEILDTIIDPDTKSKMGPENLAKLKQEIAQQKTAMDRVLNSPAVAQVKAYDSQWNIVEIDGGKDRNINLNQRLTVRRGGNIIGVIEITEVGDFEAVGELDAPKSVGVAALQPQAGDDVIPEELF